ncbi:uncharacterized protein LOC134723448 [Mytilus trossulus]|uniref:uncharacterized protein LOC134723448 n=1 Tax=Mytilus trossulus TaxID=6551 RepID=UPI003003F0FE
MATGSLKRFGQTTDEEMMDKRLKINAANTLRSNKKAGNTLREYLRETAMDIRFEEYDEVRLNEILGQFYMNARKPDGNHYKISSLENIRYGINRYLRSPPYNKTFSIIKDAAFNNANVNFKAATSELKRMGLGTTDHYPSINETDLMKLYSSIYCATNTPSGLYTKVQFDIRMYFCRRGQENMHLMTKTTFGVETDPATGLKVVRKMEDEMTKNHRETDKEESSGVMPEVKDLPYCPVSSFELYVLKLNPENNRLWQRPRSSFYSTDDTLYCHEPVGEKKLTVFMSDLSKSANLSQIYTNHSIRASGATILSKNMYGPAQIMAVTGHKSVQSLTVYQRVGNSEKIKMGHTLSDNLVKKNNAMPAISSTAILALPAPEPVSCNQLALPITESSANENIQREGGRIDFLKYLDGLDLADVFGEYKENRCVQNNVKSETRTCMQSNPAVFNDCKFTIIHNLTINK